MKLFISLYNRPEYVERSLSSLEESFSSILPDIVITDDGSTDTKVETHINTFELLYPGKIRIVRNKENKGIPFGKLDTIYKEIYDWNYDEPYFLISDSDMIYKKGWIENLVYLYEQTEAYLISGFHTLANKHEVISESNHYRIKNSIGGCNLLVDTEFYKKHPFTQKKSWDYIMCENTNRIIVSKPSVVDHIGKEGTWSIEGRFDQAEDFKETI